MTPRTPSPSSRRWPLARCSACAPCRWIVARLGKTRTVALGLFGIAFCLMGLGFVETIADALQETNRFNPFGGGPHVLRTLDPRHADDGLRRADGLRLRDAEHAAQTTLHERIPVEMRGRVLASQMVLANGVALIPLVVVGGIADLYGVSSVVLAIGVLLAIGGALSLYLDQRWLRDEGGRPHRRTEAAGSAGSRAGVTFN